MYKSIDFNTHNKRISYGHVELHISAFWTGNTIQTCVFYEYLEVPTVNVTFYIYTSAYQSRITSCNEGI